MWFHVESRKTSCVRSCPYVSDLPRRAVACDLVDELRCEVNLGVVGPDVVLRVVFEWTRCHWTDGDVQRG